MKYHTLYLFFALLLALLAGQGAWAAGTTKTVTYTISQVESDNNNDILVTFTRSGDDPFDASVTTYTCTVANSSLGSSGLAGSFFLELADGFHLSCSWSARSSVTFAGNLLTILASGKVFSFGLRCDDAYYYVTNVQMSGDGVTWSSTDYDSVWGSTLKCSSASSFDQITITYTDVPLISIFASAGENAYKIKDKHDLRHLANYVNIGQNTCEGLTFLQTTDITCDNTYVPIGSFPAIGQSRRFKGTYDGQGHRISGITVTRTGSDLYADGFIGLFGVTGSGSVVKNVIVDSSIFTGYRNVGGIAGQNEGIVQNCRVEKTTIKAGSDGATQLGGIVGTVGGNGSRVIGCISAATVYPKGKENCSRFGGIAGYIHGNRKETSVLNCIYTGTSVDAAKLKGALFGNIDMDYDFTKGYSFFNNYYTAIDLGGVGRSDKVNNSDLLGASRARIVTLGEGVTLIGEETAYNVSGLTAIDTIALRYNNAIYSGAGQKLTLGAHPGYAIASASYNDGSDHVIEPVQGVYSFTMPDADVTVTATFTVSPSLDLKVHEGTLAGVSAYWTTFYHNSFIYRLPAGASAYTMDGDHHLIRVGTDGSIIPAGKAVVIIADASALTGATADSGTLTLTRTSSTAIIHGTNILRGSDSPATVSGTPYVLGIVNGVLGFYEYKGGPVPAYKAYYVVKTP